MTFIPAFMAFSNNESSFTNTDGPHGKLKKRTRCSRRSRVFQKTHAASIIGHIRYIKGLRGFRVKIVNF